MTTIIPFKIISIGGEGFHLSMKIRINGKSANIIIDTGASKTVFDAKRIKKYVSEKKFSKHDTLSIGLGTSKIKSQFTSLKKIEIGTLEIIDFSSILLDLSHVNKSYQQLKIKQVDGILGSDILTQYKAVIDYEKKTLKLKYRLPKS